SGSGTRERPGSPLTGAAGTGRPPPRTGSERRATSAMNAGNRLLIGNHLAAVARGQRFQERDVDAVLLVDDLGAGRVVDELHRPVGIQPHSPVRVQTPVVGHMLIARVVERARPVIVGRSAW